MPRTLTLAAFAALCTLALTCKKEPPVVPEATLSLTAVDASCIEAWLKVTTTQVPATVRLLRDGQPVSVLGLRSSDSLVIDEGLLPKRAYTYHLQRLDENANVIETSPSVQLTTMDTTSHNFTWQIDTLGDGGGSVLYDVAIINDTLAYAVGEIYKRDSLGNWDPNAYNAVKWNGNTWELKRIPFVGPCSAVDYPPIRAIWAFSETNILFARGGSIVRYDGTNAVLDCGMNSLLAGAINRLYATNPQDVYLVGNAGTIAHYDGVRWRRIESGTTLPIMDIYGARDPRTGRYEILCVAEAYGVPGASKIFTIENGNARELTTSGLESWGVAGIWFVPDREYIVVGQGVWRSRSAVGRWWFDDTLPRIATTSICSQNLNDIVVGGAFWLLAHWNGVRWQTYFARTAGALGGIALKGNLLITVGFIGNQAVVIRGRRR